MENILQAGYSRRSITPDFSVPLAGYGATDRRMSTEVLSEIFATCIAFTCGEEKVLLYSQDLIRCNPKWTDALRERVSQRTGVRPDHIMVCSTHTHSAPDVLSNLDCMQDYCAFYLDVLEQAAVEALEDLAPITVKGTKTHTHNMNFVRHYLLENGTYAGPNFGDFTSAPVVRHADKNDPEVLLVKLERQEKPSILMVNFQVHPTATGGNASTKISADFITSLRDNLEASTQMQVAYFTGAAGNQVLGSRLTSETDGQSTKDHRAFGGSHYLIYGWRLAKYVIHALPDLQDLHSNTLKTTQTMLELDVNHDDEDRYEDALRVRQTWNEVDRTTANKLAKSLGISSVYHAGAILTRRNRPQRNAMELDAIRIGEITFVTMPYEGFGAHGVYVKENSPFDFTMVFSCANAGWNYIPTAEAYEYGCYESFTSYFAKGSGETAAETLVEMLGKLK